MTRAPLPALRRLFAVGGAPAASHVVLSRAPTSGRLLEPLARTRIANDTSLDALARPLDVGRMLARVMDAATPVREPSIEGQVRVPRAAKSVAPRPEAASSSEATPAPSLVVRPRSVTRPPVDAAAVRAAVARAFNEPAVAHGRVAIAPAADPAREQRFAPREASVTPRVRFTTIEAEPRYQARSAVANAGAEARVVVGSPSAEIERLLAAAAPSVPPASSPRRVTSAERAPETNDVSRLLASAVDRARSASAPSPAMAAPVAARSLPAFSDASQRITTQVAAPDIETSGGFRGLAQRTLVSKGSAPVRRVEPEHRTPMDLTLDSLDTKVADSLARVLEREARRHGIDLAEARA